MWHHDLPAQQIKASSDNNKSDTYLGPSLYATYSAVG